ncbi:uncharacterized protein LOC115789891 [Archocentrus centrarchus]|uniref:uncharacterized protein LOC115789891 n=1 Tax=Archocentrus centrarchus TaxID=63155 RepID=UPI0011E9DF6C|nr:sarcoplasmic/endoplasmic reticulum calcium ATPase regulator DWORF [Archocentrus centrarchus]
MDCIPTPPDLFHPALPDANIKSSQQVGWFCTHHNKKIRAERDAMSKQVAGPSDSSYKLFPVLLIVGWIVGCIAVVYFVFIFAWKSGV